MHFLNKLRMLFGLSLILVIIMRIIIPGFKETKREKMVSNKDVEDFKKSAIKIKISNYTVSDAKTEVYFDGTPFIKNYSTKEVAYVEDKDNSQVYKIELYEPTIYIKAQNNSKDVLYLVIGAREVYKKGTTSDPIIALRYTLGNDFDYFVPENNFNFNIKEYLTYKNYTPPDTDSYLYYLTMAWVFLTIAGFAISTGILIKRG